ncbi:MAG TPA: cytochrome c biogenesis protein ResB, partial [Gemmataceae bacterium]|nr:cytochrome c biogenesis protein ResB [Gemmataceae bacterium]
PALLSEFLNPPAPDKASPKGTLVLGLEGRKPVRFDVAELLGGEPRPVGDTGWKVRVTEYDPAFRFGDNDGTAANPLVKYDLINPAGETLNFWAAGRLPGQPLPVNKAAAHFDGLEGWYHAPDYRWGKRQTRGVLDLVACGDKLYYRSFHSGGLGGFRFEASGPLAEGAGQPIWKGMDWEIQVLEFLPRAVVKERFVPVNVRPGLDREDLTAAIRCKLTVTPRNGKEQTQEFWVARTDSSSTPVTVGGETFRVGFNTKSQDLGFQVKLLRAEQKVDPGTQSPATYTSFVQLTDAKRGIHGEDRIITMNEPLEHNGYKLYQSGYMFLGPDPATGRPVNRSTLTVGYDPGIDWWFGAPKYTGLIMLVLGIVIMFYMKAYFFKPLARKAKAPGTKDGLPQVA